MRKGLQAFRPTIDLLADRWGDAGPLLQGFPLLARGKPLAIEEIAEAAGINVKGVERAVDAARCERDAEGRLIDLYGLTLTPTPHRLEIDKKILFSCCALWAHVVPKLVKATVQVESIDPIRREVVRLSVSPAGVESVDPAESAATLAAATEEAIAANVYEAFCFQVRHFISRESADEFSRALPSCHSVDLSEIQEAADLLHDAIWSAISPPSDRRLTDC